MQNHRKKIYRTDLRSPMIALSIIGLVLLLMVFLFMTNKVE